MSNPNTIKMGTPALPVSQIRVLIASVKTIFLAEKWVDVVEVFAVEELGLIERVDADSFIVSETGLSWLNKNTLARGAVARSMRPMRADRRAFKARMQK